MSTRTSRDATRPAVKSHLIRRGGVAALAATAGLLAAGAPAAASAPVLNTYVSNGSKGPEVTEVQRALHVRATHHFDPVTRHAVLAFQRRKGLAVDGIVGPETWDALFHIQPPASTPSTAADTGSSSTADSAGSGGYSIPSQIVQCESGGNYSAVNPSSGAGGAYQILPSTWQAYGGQGLPQDASPAEQSRIASEIYARQGSSAWSC
jgi:peptidoglycan hydrolase-like protein with peptidoglycan-binding domain